MGTPTQAIEQKAEEQEGWDTWREEMPTEEQLTFDALHIRTAWALRGLIDQATIELVVEETLWQMHLLARRRAIVALPGIGCALRLPLRQVLLAWRWLTGRDGGH